MPGSDQAWVTLALDDSQSLRTLVLARSLRRVITSKKLAVITSQDVSDSMRSLLEDEFDVVINVGLESSNTKGLPSTLFAKLYSWKLTFFNKCVFLDPNAWVLQNCDEIFDWDEMSAAVDLSRANCFEPSIFVLKPSFQTFNAIASFVKTTGLVKENGLDILNMYFKDWSKSKGKVLPSDFNTAVSLNTTFDQFSSNLKIVRFCGINPLLENHEKSKTQYYDILSQTWMNIFNDDVQPKLTSAMNLDPNLKLNGYKLHSTPPAVSTTGFTKDDHTYLSDSVAIVGMSCRFPGANSADEFWELLVEGKDAIQEVPLDRWNKYPRDDDTLGTKAGFLKCPIDEFDAKFFGVSPREAAFTDPQQRLLLEVSWEALENAGINPHQLKGSNTGVFMGVWAADYERMLRNVAKGADAHRIYLGNAYSAISSRVSFFLGLDGPNIATESGCSSSSVSLHLACESLRKSEVSLALAGGVNLLIQAFPLTGPAKPVFLSPDGHCKTFDEKADGFGRAEGCGVVVLKRYADAQRDGDRILAIVRGSAVNSEGTTANFGAPSKNCQAKVIKEALKNSGVKPSSVGYVEAHGTGTIIGDPIEVSAIASGYSEGRRDPLVIGSVKTNIGHTEGAAGMAGLIKVVMAMQNELIPPHCNLDTLNPNINFEEIPAIVPLKAKQWKKDANRKRIAGISSFGISGTNVHVLIEESPTGSCIKPPELEIERPQHILTLSAKNEDALAELAVKYQSYLKNNSEMKIENVAYTANTGRAHFPHRLAVIGKDTAQIQSRLEKKLYAFGRTTPGKPQIAFLFTGQGSQYIGMAKRLYHTHPIFKKALDRCANLLHNNLGISLLNVIWNDTPGDSNNGHSLDQTVYSQTSIFCIEYSLLQLWESFGVSPHFVLGHSVGEFAAATAAGIMTLEEAIRLVAERSRLIQSMPKGGMLAVKSSPENVRKLLDEFINDNPGLWLDIAVINSMEEVVVAGRPNALDSFTESCTNQGIKTLRVAATHAFHSREMEGIMDEFGKVAAGISYKNPKCGYVSGRDGRILEKEDIDAKYWQQHARENVNFTAGMKTLFNQGVRIFVEIGPHPILLALGMTNVSPNEAQESTWLPSIRKNDEEWITILSSLARLYIKGVQINWDNFDAPFSRKKLELPTYPFQRQRYWYDFDVAGKEMVLTTKIQHPLLGRPAPIVSSAEICVNIFQQSIDLEYLSYLKDHQVANRVILPGAGFLEMILAAGNLSAQGTDGISILDSGAPITVEDFMIEAPLELGTDEGVHLQILSAPRNLDAPAELNVSVFRRLGLEEAESNNKWKRYAIAKFTTVVSQTQENLKLDGLETIKNRCMPEISTEELYKRVPELGIFFGTTFQSISKFWKGKAEVLAEIPSPQEAGNLREYIGHPVVLDAMIQAFALTMDEESKSLYLPIGVEKFICFARSSTKTMYAHTTWKDPENRLKGTIKLYDESGVQLGIMEGVRIVRTSVAAFLNALNSKRKALPGLYQEVWSQISGTVNSRVDLDVVPDINDVKVKLHEKLEELDDFFVKSKNGRVLYDRLVYLQIVKTFYQVNWVPKLNQVIQSREFLVDHLIAPKFQGLIELFFSILVEEGILSRSTNDDTDTTEWKIIQLPISNADIDDCIESAVVDCKNEVAKGEGISLVDLYVLRRVGEYLPSVIQNRMSGLNVLFPEEDEGAVSAVTFYNESKMYTSANQILPQILEESFGHLTTKTRNPTQVLRLLEVGAGVGSTTEYVLPTLIKFNIPFHYTFTDISPLFLSKAKSKFEKYGNNVCYKLLNIEQDPKSQGFAPNQFDVVLAANVLHATEYLQESIAHVRHLMAPNGKLMLIEPFAQARLVHMVFGILDGWWRFKDYDARPESPLASVATWHKILRTNGFASSLVLPTYGHIIGCIVANASKTTPIFPSLGDNHRWVIFIDEDQKNKILPPLLKHFEEISQKLIFVQTGESFKMITEDSYQVNPTVPLDFKTLFVSIQEKNIEIDGLLYLWGYKKSIEEFEQPKICGGLLHLVQGVMAVGQKLKAKPKLIVVTDGVSHIGDQTAGNPSAGTLLGVSKTISAGVPDVKPKFIDLDPDELDYVKMGKCIFDEIWINDDEFQIAYRQCKRQSVRFATLTPIPPLLSLPNSERYKLVLPESKTISDLSLGPMAKQELKPGQIEILVKAVALNFRDIFVIMRPDTYDSRFDAVGTDFSGVITAIGSEVTEYKVGDSVFGLSSEGAISSHVIVGPQNVLRKPDFLSHVEVCGYSSVYLTAYYSLVTIAGLKAGENVLIHSAAGGVGLAAVHIAKTIGAVVIATAGNRRKRTLLQSMGIKHTFNSRNTDYGDEIERALNGAKISVVLNALTSAGFKEASLKVCAPGARFIEMGKVGIWKPEEVKSLRPDVVYSIVDLEKVDLIDGNVHLMEALKFTMSSEERGFYLPVTRYELSHLTHAFNYFQTGQHIGKICIAMPELKVSAGKVEAHELLFNDMSTYLITGGLGGIGLEVAKWMVSAGAKNVVLVGRSAPNTKVKEVLDDLELQGARVITRQCDIGDFEQCQVLMDWIKSNFPPLKGIMHAAGALADAMIINQTWSKFHTVFNAKVSGAWNLHNLTLDCHLDHFILYSSVAGIFGSFAQANHAAANIFLDSFAHYRNSLGMPTQSINWGLWGDVGVAADTSLGKDGGFGIKPFNVAQGIAALKTIMTNNLKQTAVLEIDPLALKQTYTNYLGNYFEQLLSGVKDAVSAVNSAEAETFWNEIKEIPEEERVAYIKGHIENIIRQTLKMSEAEQIDEHQSFSEMGMDSLMAVEMRNRLQLIFGKYVTLNATSLLDYPTVGKLSVYLAELVNSIQDTLLAEEALKNDATKIEVLRTESPQPASIIIDEKLISADSKLPAHIKSSGEVKKSAELHSIFLTGATGQLGIFLLNELTKVNNLKIFCLIRSRNQEDGRKRLMQKLRKYDLQKDTNLSNVEIVSGNIANKQLGLSEEMYKRLSLEIDAIIHCAVKANHVEKYEVVRNSVNDLRSVNVFGTVNVLEFASAGKTKYVLHASSLVAYTKITEDGRLAEEFPANDDLGEKIKLGYSLSKFICEKLVKEAVARGIPCSVIRFPTIVGHSQTGQFSPETNHLMLFMLACMSLGMQPQLGGSWSSMPVDSAAKIALKIFFSDQARNEVYNITNPFVSNQEQLNEVTREKGFETKIVTHDEWKQSLESKGEKSLLFPFRDIYLKEDGLFSLIKSSPATELAFKDDHKLFALSDKARKIVGNIDAIIPHNLVVFRRHIEYAQRSGLFKMFDLE